MNAIDKAIGWLGDRYRYAAVKFRIPDKAPPYVKTEIIENPGIDNYIWDDWSIDKQAKVAASVSWIFSNLFRIANEVSTADFTIVDKKTGEKVEDPLQEIFDFPNEFFDGTALWKYTVWGAYLGQYGALWYLAPDKNDFTKISEIWPIPIDRIEPVKHKTKFISAWKYKSRKTGRSIIIPTQYTARFFFPHPWDLWENYTPIVASTLAISTYESITRNQRDLHSKGRGVPLAIVSVDPNISKEDFAVVRQQLHEDWESERNIAITRGGDVDVATVGISNRELEIIASQNFNRDELDALYMGGIPWRSDQFKSGEGLREANKQVKEVVIRPFHVMLQNRVYLDILSIWGNSNHFGNFQDVRAQDRSILIQERTIYWRAKTIDEARAELGLPPYIVPEGLYSDYGNLLVPLANNSQFVTLLSGLSDQPMGLGPGNQQNGNQEDDPIGNLPGQLDAERVVNENIDDAAKSIDIKAAVISGMSEELKRYRKVLLRRWRDDRDIDLTSVKFDTNIILPDVMKEIKSNLTNIETEDDIRQAFGNWLE